MGLNVRSLEAICVKQDSKGASVYVPQRYNPLRWVENQWQWWWMGEGMDRVGDGGDGWMEQQGMDSGEERTRLSDSRQSTMNHNQGLTWGLTHDW